MGSIELGVQLYTMRKLCKTPHGVKEVMERIAKLGAKTVQISSICEMNAGELRKIADDNDLTINGTHSPFERIKNNLDVLAEEHLVLGAEIVGLGMMPLAYSSSEEGLRRFIDFAGETVEKLKPYGLKFGYHNHSGEFKKLGGKPKLDIMIESLPEMQFILDTFWVKFAGYEPVEYIKKLKGRLNLLHLKDYKKTFFIPHIKDVGSGSLDFSEILKQAELTGTKWAVIEHDNTTKPYETIENSITYLKSIYNGGAK